MFCLVGVFGAARYGLQTEGNLLVNDWLGGGRGEGWLDAAVLAYLAISMPPIQVDPAPCYFVFSHCGLLWVSAATFAARLLKEAYAASHKAFAILIFVAFCSSQQ